MSRPKISCLMPFTARFPDEGHLPAEALWSFLSQDYENKELIVCDDTPGQTIRCDSPGVVVLNTPRFDTLSDKLEFMIERASGEWLTRWDDDDFQAPWRLSLSMDRAREAGSLEWRALNHWYTPGNGSYSETWRPGNTHNMQLFHRELLDKIGGYPPKLSGPEDQAFIQRCQRAGHDTGDILDPLLIFCVYRFGVSSRHLSGVGGTPERMQEHWDDMAKRALPGTYELRPTRHRDYIAEAQKIGRRNAKRSAQSQVL